MADFNTRFPWAFVLFSGFLPAVSEEFLFRMFAIPFLRNLVRSIIAALILAGFRWGFGHAGYSQQPFYIRGVEVGGGRFASLELWKEVEPALGAISMSMVPVLPSQRCPQ